MLDEHERNESLFLANEERRQKRDFFGNIPEFI